MPRGRGTNYKLKVMSINVSVMLINAVRKLVDDYGLYASVSEALRNYVRLGLEKDLGDLGSLSNGVITKESFKEEIVKELMEDFE